METHSRLFCYDDNSFCKKILLLGIGKVLSHVTSQPPTPISHA